MARSASLSDSALGFRDLVRAVDCCEQPGMDVSVADVPDDRTNEAACLHVEAYLVHAFRQARRMSGGRPIHDERRSKISHLGSARP